MGSNQVKHIAVLTSSRADYGIYLPLINKISESREIELSIIAFGTHLSIYHGKTVDQIITDGFKVNHTVSSMLLGDDPESIASAIGLTSIKFAGFWKEHINRFNLVLCLGDRYEMFAAVYAGIPYGIKFGHIHGGETTLGAIDNIYRHALTLTSSYHFCATAIFKDRIKEITGKDENIHVVGALSLDSVSSMQLLSMKEFSDRWSIDLSKPTILVTIHPETVGYQKNKFFASEAKNALNKLAESWQIVITMPNADTMGTVYREKFVELGMALKNVKIVESFGTQGYFTCMKYSRLLLGNTSSGIIEAASFGKYVINLGYRQSGRLASENVIHKPFDSIEIVSAVKAIDKKGGFEGINLYDQGGAADKILKVLRNV